MNKYKVVLKRTAYYTQNPIIEIEAPSMSCAILLAMIQTASPEEIIVSVTKI